MKKAQKKITPAPAMQELEFTDPPMWRYWHRITSKAAELDPDAFRSDVEIRKVAHSRFLTASTKPIWITSQDLPEQNIRGGRVFCATPMLAAKCIVDGSHRLATKKEIRAEQKEQVLRKAHPAPSPLISIATTGEVNWRRVSKPAPLTPRQEWAAWARAGVTHLRKLCHPRLERLRLRFYRPTPGNDDWILSPEKRAKVSARISDLMTGRPPGFWIVALEHWRYIIAGAALGAAAILITVAAVRP